ncbi:hypothetical protein [Sphingomonas sanguinis]|uniref:hypothetical protein n=1 Tax=Sphingomonas sanguinis TaxID=33051 RepID=UPI000AB1E8AC|nr:hypothetical protein [Sphingomonas sanguinis]
MLPSLPALLAIFLPFTAQAEHNSIKSKKIAPVSRNMCIAPSGWVRPFEQIYHFRNGATVIFIGVEHTNDLNDETHRQIRDSFEKYKPSFVLVEGTSSAKSEFKWFRDDLAKLAKERVQEGAASENLYAVTLAVGFGAQFSGWDFNPDQDYKVLIEDGFTVPDALGAHLLRSHINPFLQDGGVRAVERQLRYAATIRPITSFDYLAWYRQAYGNEFDINNGTPCGKGIGSRVIDDLSYRRNLNLAGLIDRAALPGKTILVEAGANHWLALKDHLQSQSVATD